MVFKNGLKNIKKAGYNGAPKVVTSTLMGPFFCTKNE